MKPTLTVALLSGLFAASVAQAQSLEFKDPKGDDKGPGTYTYPTDTVYERGSFDLTKATFEDKGSTIDVTVTMNARIKDPWRSKTWEGKGNGFSVQMLFIFIDQDKKAGSGHKQGLPGLNVSFKESARWEKALIISPQSNLVLKREVKAKAKKMAGDVILPKTVKVRGKAITARFDKKALGGLAKTWGYQILVQSNEGYPDKTELLTRKVNEYGGQHRFGGGNDYNCDPHVIDMLAGQGQGAGSEKAAQFKQLKTYKCNDEEPEKGTQATIDMVYPEG